HVGDQPSRGNQGRMHPQLDAAGLALGDAEELDAVAQFLGITDVLAGELRDAFGVDRRELHLDTNSDGRHDGELVRLVHALNVEGRVGHGIAPLLRLTENVRETRPLLAHFGQYEIAGAVDDPGDPFDAVGGEPLAQRFDDGYAATDRTFERDHDVFLPGCREDLVAVLREQRLVCCDDVLAAGECLEDQFLRYAGAPDELDHDVDIRVVDHFVGIGRDRGASASNAARSREVLIGDQLYGNGASGAPRDFLLVALEDGESTPSHRADTEQSHIDRPERGAFLLHSKPSFLNISLIPLIACRVRASFSIKAKGTCRSP